jgi:hypothetical protein
MTKGPDGAMSGYLPPTRWSVPDPDLIDYEITDQGECSYCGTVAEIQPLPDGGDCYSSSCIHCDDYNQGVRADRRVGSDDVPDARGE